MMHGIWRVDSIAPLMLNLSARWRCVARLTSWPLYLRERAM